jgi:hypothetical protein
LSLTRWRFRFTCNDHPLRPQHGMGGGAVGVWGGCRQVHGRVCKGDGEKRRVVKKASTLQFVVFFARLQRLPPHPLRVYVDEERERERTRIIVKNNKKF